MKPFRYLCLFALGWAGIAAAPAHQSGPPKDPQAALREIREIQSAARQAQAQNLPPDPALPGKIKALAQEATKGVDPLKTSPNLSSDWMELFTLAGDEKSGDILAQRSFDQKAFELMDLSTRVFKAHLRAGRLADARSMVRYMGFGGGPSMIGQFHDIVRRDLRAVPKERLAEVLAIYGELEGRIHSGSPLSKGDQNWIPYVYADVVGEKFSILYRSGKKDEALKGLKALEAKIKLTPESRNAHGGTALALVQRTITDLTSGETQGALVAKQAPPLVFEKSLGEFAGLTSLKGKVLVLDFMAHWCGPCKAALPSLAKLQDDLGSKGVQVVSLTSYYGYYGAKQGISRTEEFELMKTFVKDFKMAWPVLFDSTGKNNQNYGVTGIPHLVVIDQKGVVRRMEVGFTPEGFAVTRKLIESLVGSVGSPN